MTSQTATLPTTLAPALRVGRATVALLMALLLLAAGRAFAGATADPNPAVSGGAVVITYDANGTALSGASTVTMHYGWDNWLVVNDTAMTSQGGGLWQVELAVPNGPSSLDFVFNDGAGTWDNNGGANWHVDVVAGPQVELIPAEPLAGQHLAVIYDAAQGPLAGSGSMWLHWGRNGWNGTTQTPMERYSGTEWVANITLPEGTSTLDFAFTNGNGGWDNNGGGDWHVAVQSAAGQTITLSPFAMATVQSVTAYGINQKNILTNQLEVGNPDHRRTMMCAAAFNLSAIPNDAAIVSAQLVYTASGFYEGPYPYGTHAFKHTPTWAATTEDPELAYQTIGGAQSFASTDLSTFPLQGSEQILNLDAGALALLEGSLAQDEWTVGIVRTGGTGSHTLVSFALRLTFAQGEPLTSNFASMSFVGDFNGWDPSVNNMVLVDDGLWSATYAFAGEDSISFKFAANGTWAENWGDIEAKWGIYAPLLSVAQPGAADIKILGPVYGTHDIFFDENSLVYSIKRQD
ncbi:MAG: carbohydrate-binding protein [Sumerlaeia bacterium]